MGKRSMSAVSLDKEWKKEDEDSSAGDYVDGNLITRDVTLCEGRIQMSDEFMIEEKGFKLYHPIYLLKSGVEVSLLELLTV